MIYWGTELESLSWPADAESQFVRRYLCELAAGGTEAFIRNAGGTEVGLAVLGHGRVLVPLSRPCRRPCWPWRRSYTSSAHSHFGWVVIDEVLVLRPVLARRLQLRGLKPAGLADFVAAVAAAVLIGVCWCWILVGWCCSMDKVVYVNNFLLSTNLHPSQMPKEPERLEALLRELTEELLASHPSHALAYRSLDEIGSPHTLAALDKLGWSRVPERYVHYQDVLSEEVWGRNPIKNDQKLARKQLCNADSSDGQYEWQLLDSAPAPRVLDRVVELYVLLYIDKYTACNPQYTAEFVRTAVTQQLLTVFILVNVRHGEIDGVIGYYRRGGLLTTPFFGYETRLPQAVGLYRLLSLKIMQEAKRHGLCCHASGGAGDFKRSRGATSAVELMQVYASHLGWRQRVPWSLLERLGRAIRHMQQPH